MSTIIPAGGTVAIEVPTGTIMPYAGSGTPSGWTRCNGFAYSRTGNQFANLFAVIGTIYGDGDGSGNQFNVPNLRGEFIRFTNNSANVGINREWLTGRPSTPINRPSSFAGGHTHNVTMTTQQAHTHSIAGDRDGGSGQGLERAGNTTRTVQTSNNGAHEHSLVLNAVGDHTHPFEWSGGDAETAPRNIAMWYVIKL